MRRLLRPTTAAVVATTIWSLLNAFDAAAAPRLAERLSDPPRRPWQHWKIPRADAPAIDVYATADAQPRPLVVFAAGSHCVPAFFFQQRGSERRLRSTLPFQDFLESGQHRVHFAVVERRGLKSFEELPQGQLHDECTAEHGSLSKEDRVRDVADVVMALREQPWVSEIIVAGHSEGADVATGVARALPHDVRAVALFAGGGPSQFFDHVVEARRDGSDADGQTVFDELLAMTGPHPPADYRGFGRERYVSYALRSTALEDLSDLELPVFIAQGTRDRNSPVQSADLLAVELLRRRPERAVFYLLLPGLDHGFFSGDGADHQSEVFSAFVDWTTQARRGVESRTLGASPQADGHSSASTPRVRYLGVDARIWRVLLPSSAALVMLYLAVRAVRRRRREPLQ